MKQKKPDQQARRHFLRGSVAAGAGVTVAAAVPGVALGADAQGQQDAPKNEKYRVTKHISDYYKSTF